MPTIGSITINTSKRICNVCGEKAHVKDKNKWWCSLDFHTAHGFCPKQKKGTNEKSSDD